METTSRLHSPPRVCVCTPLVGLKLFQTLGGIYYGFNMMIVPLSGKY